MVDEFSVLKNKLELIINKYHNSEDVKEFEGLLNKLNSIKNFSIVIHNNNFFSRMFATIYANIFKPRKTEFEIEEYVDIKSKAIQLYCERILKKEYPIRIEMVNNNADAYFTDAYGFQANEKLFNEIKKYQIAYTRLKEKQYGEIEVYPWNVKKEALERTTDKEYLAVSEKFLTTQCSIEEAFNERYLSLSDKNKVIRNKFMKTHIAPYYGDSEFICERAKYILNCMEMIVTDEVVKSENKKVTRNLIDEARAIVSKIENYKSGLSINQDNDTYEKMKTCFEKLLFFENVISKDIEQIWNEFLTKPEDYKEGSRFAFLTHTYTEKIVAADLMYKCCCTLVTEKCMPIPYGNIGVICGFKSANIGTMCTEDAGSWVISQEEFYDRGIPIGWQFAETAGDGKNRVFYEYPKISKLILPTTMEKEMLENNLSIKEKNGNAQEYRAYTEIFMVRGKNDESIPVQEMFFTDEKGRTRAEAINMGYHPILIDPSSGTVVPFLGKKHKEIDNLEQT